MSLANVKAVVDVVIPVLSLLVAILIPLAGFLYQRRERRRGGRPAPAPVWQPAPAAAGTQLPLLIRDARLVSGTDDAGRPQFTIALTFGSPPEKAPTPTPVPEERPTPISPAPPVPPPERIITELRVDGVSGARAEELLNAPVVTRVAGDDDAGFFRPRPEYGDAEPTGIRREAYRWSTLTASAGSRGLWLLLLPFTLTNLAYWMRPPTREAGLVTIRALCRVLALSSTLAMITSTTGVGLDLVAWQCASPGSRCLAARPVLGTLFSGFFAPTGRRLALAALVPILSLAVLWYLGYRTWVRYESYGSTGFGVPGEGLSSPDFWNGRAQVARLRAIHVASALAVVDAVLLYVLLRHDRSGGFEGVDPGLPPSTVVLLGTLLAAATAVLLLSCLILLLVPAMTARGSWSPVAARIGTAVRWTGLALTAATLGYALLPRAPWPSVGQLPGFAKLGSTLLALQGILLVLLTIAAARTRHRYARDPLGGFGAPIVASLGVSVGAVFSSTLTFRVADYLDVSSGTTATFAPNRLEPALPDQWAALGFVAAAVLVLLAIAWSRLVVRPLLQRHARADTDTDYPGGRARDPWRAGQIDRAIAEARLTEPVARSLVVAWFFLIGGAVMATIFTIADVGPAELAPTGSTGAHVLAFLTNLGSYLASLLLIGVVVLGVVMYRSRAIRRTLGVLWDAATFWPRAAHPLASPCYAERVVPELVHRSAWLATEQGGVILSGEGQGAVLAAAAVLQLPHQAVAATGVVTTGSPLGRLYPNLFPASLPAAALRSIAARLADPTGTRWLNLWRFTDPIGGPVGIPGVDHRIRDPRSFDPPPGDTRPTPILDGSGYRQDPAYEAAVAEVGRPSTRD